MGILNGKQRYFCREAQRQGDESLLSITNEWTKSQVFAEVRCERSECLSTKPKLCKFEHSLRSHHTSQTNKLTNRSKLRLFLLRVYLQ